jgi:hypothetical protein
MNETSNPQLFLQTSFHGIWLVLAPSAAGTRLLMDLAARLALEGPLRVLDGGNRFNAYQCSQDLTRYLTAPGARAGRGNGRGGASLGGKGVSTVDSSAPSSDRNGALTEDSPLPLPDRPRTLKQALARIYLARAFTCYQMLTLLSETPAIPRQPTLALDLLATFYDESVRATDALHLLENCLADLRRLSAHAPVVVSGRPPRPGRGFTYGFTPESARPELMESLKIAADEVVAWEAPGREENQLRFL